VTLQLKVENVSSPILISFFFFFLAHFGQAIAFVLLALTQDNRVLSVFFLTVATGFTAGVYVGTQAGFVDLAPNFSGAIFSVANCLSACLGLCGPIVIGYIVTETVSLMSECLGSVSP